MQEQSELALVAAEVIHCVKCPLHKARKNAVPGEGNPNAKIMFIGEAPGYWEDVKGKPFVGAAGKLLDTLLAEAEIPRTQVFIGNVVKCRPPRNREPTPAEIQTCTPYLDRQITAIKPKLIVTLGNHSTAYILTKAGIPFKGITKARGKPHQTTILGINITVFPTLHPAAALYNPKYKQQLTQDFQTLKAKIHELNLTSST
ncbi:MAG: type-4 uracil-DNA glycosylase [Candidatus Bathyarchaeia archaeon]